MCGNVAFQLSDCNPRGVARASETQDVEPAGALLDAASLRFIFGISCRTKPEALGAPVLPFQSLTPDPDGKAAPPVPPRRGSRHASLQPTTLIQVCPDCAG